MEEHMGLILGMLGIGQVVTSVISWYFGMHIKMLRIELVTRSECHKRCEEFSRVLHDLRVDVERVKLEGSHHA